MHAVGADYILSSGSKTVLLVFFSFLNGWVLFFSRSEDKTNDPGCQEVGAA